MALVQELESQGNWLFRFRSYLPLVLFVLVIPAMLESPEPNDILSPFAWTIIAVLISVAGAVVRAYTIGTTPRGTSGRNTKQQVAESLNTTGIYSVVRHPLYLGNYLMWIGIVCFTGNVAFILMVTLMYWLYYERIMMAEEQFLTAKFGEAYQKWSAQTPPFIPAFGRFTPPSVSFSLRSVFRREYSGWLATVVGFAYVDFLRLLISAGFSWNAAGDTWLLHWNIILPVATLLTLCLRTLKHHTGILKEEGRS